MKRWFSVLVVAALAGGTGTARGGNSPSVLSQVRYNVQGSASVVSLAFQGPIAYVNAPQPDRIVLGFTNTRVASPPGAARLVFQSGFVRGVSIDRVRADSTRVTIALRENTTYTIVRSEEGRVLRIEVERAGGGVKYLATGSPSAHTGKQMKRQKTEHTSSLVDIPAIARSEAGDRNASQAPTGQPVQPEATKTSALSPLVLVAAMIGCALLGTILLLVVAGKKQIGVLAIKSRVADVPAPGPGVASPKPVRAETAPCEVEVAGEDDAREEEPLEIDDSTEQLAKSFRRGQEELRLVARLHAGGSGASAKRVSRACAPTASRTQRARTAKKLGIGQGEIDLALHLRELAEEHRQQETVE